MEHKFVSCLAVVVKGNVYNTLIKQQRQEWLLSIADATDVKLEYEENNDQKNVPLQYIMLSRQQIMVFSNYLRDPHSYEL